MRFLPYRWRLLAMIGGIALLPAALPAPAAAQGLSRDSLRPSMAADPARAWPFITVPHSRRRTPVGYEGNRAWPFITFPPARDNDSSASPRPASPGSIPSTLPERDRLFRLETEQGWRARIIKEPRPVALPFGVLPDERPLIAELTCRCWPVQVEMVEPSYVCYAPLLFEAKNTERYGWDLGIIQPLVSAGAFLYEANKLPFSLAVYVTTPVECSAGYCLPGDPVPLLLYPPGGGLPGLRWKPGVGPASGPTRALLGGN